MVGIRTRSRAAKGRSLIASPSFLCGCQLYTILHPFLSNSLKIFFFKCPYFPAKIKSVGAYNIFPAQIVLVVVWRILVSTWVYGVRRTISCLKLVGPCYSFVWFLTLLLVSAPEQWTLIPVPVKLFKLIINELGTLLESATTGDEHEDGDSDDVSIRVPSLI